MHASLFEDKLKGLFTKQMSEKIQLTFVNLVVKLRIILKVRLP